MILALELAADSTSALLCDDAGQPRETARRAFTTTQNAATRWLEAIQLARDTLFRLALEPQNLDLVIFAFDGKIAPDSTVVRTPFSLGFEGYNLERGLREHLGAPHILLCQSLEARAVGEARYGALGGEENWLWLQLGTRVQSSAAKGKERFTTHVEALVLDRDGPLDEFGRRGTLGAYCGRDSFAARCASYGLTVAPEQVFEMAASNFAAQSLCDDFAARLAQGLAGATAVLGTSTVCVGGEFGELIWPHLEKTLPPKTRDFAGGEAPHLRASSLGRDGAVLGALALGLESLE